MTPAEPQGGVLLTVNAGSSSVKLALYGNDAALRARLAVSVERIGCTGRLTVMSPDDVSSTSDVDARDHAEALRVAIDAAERVRPFIPDAIGHRFVHGGASHAEPVRVTPALLDDLRGLVSIDPSHAPQALACVEVASARYPSVPQVACFDTTFHRTMPEVAQRYPLPGWAWTAGIRRYGFHGLSCESIVQTLAAVAPPAAKGRLLIAHLGNGASVTAVRGGRSVDTTMGFSPTGGLMMGTRAGDLDPTVVTFLSRTRGLDAAALDGLFNRESGLLGVSGLSADMRDLLDRSDTEPAREAIELFCYIARRHMGALAAALGGVDTIVFTGGIGEHAATIRARICEGLEHLGLEIDAERNTHTAAIVSTDRSRVTVRVMHTDEDRVIAAHVRRMLA